MDLNAPVTHKELRRYIRGAAVAFVAMLTATGYVLSTKPDVEAQRVAFIEACENENYLHAQSNNTALVAFNVLSNAGREAAVLHSEARKLRITGLADCVEATDNPRGYVYPEAHTVGDPETGKINPKVAAIVAESRRLLRDTERSELDDRHE